MPPQATYIFPNGFLWGTSTSSHQVEGGNTNNNWSAFEAEPGRILQGHTSGLACDWWGGRWKDDFDRAAETGQNAHRLSIEWSRVQPAPDRWDENALDVYRSMLRGLAERRMTAMVTLHHFTDPLWLTERGGWENDETPALFAAYAARVVEALKGFTTMWVTINEPNVYALCGYQTGNFPPGKNDLSLAVRVLANMVRGHAAAYRVIHRIQPEAQVGIAQNYRAFRPARPAFPPDHWIAGFLQQNYNDAFPRALVDGRLLYSLRSVAIPEAAKTMDFLGVNYYSLDLIKFDPLANKNYFHSRIYPADAEVSDTGFIANVPEGFSLALNWAKGYQMPIFVTENGIEDADDDLRPRYMFEHIHQVWRAVNNNIPIKGYFHWSLVDNFEWERGWTQRFGLWGLDLDTRARIRRTSVDAYAAICKTNGISSEMVTRWAPGSFAKLFPE